MSSGSTIPTAGSSRHPDKVGSEPEHAWRLAERAAAALRRGRELLAWLQPRQRTRAFRQWFPLFRALNPDDQAYGFFDVAVVDDRPMPVMGVVQEMPFDWAKGVDPRHTRGQLREYVLRYLLRSSDYTAPQAVIPSSASPRDETVFGFGYSQSLYRTASGQLGYFDLPDRYTIIDLRQLGPIYEWIVARVKLFSFAVTLDPLGAGLPRLEVPLDEDQDLALSTDLITDQSRDGVPVIGRFGLGYALIKNPRQGLLAYGPGYFEAGVKTIEFRLAATGRISVHMRFVVNRPGRIFNIPLDPTLPALQTLDSLTLGWMGRRGVSPEGLERAFLLQHHLQHYQMISGALSTWAQVPDWQDESTIPVWVRRGVAP